MPISIFTSPSFDHSLSNLFRRLRTKQKSPYFAYSLMFFFLYIILRAKLTQRTDTHVHTLPVSILASPSSIIQEVEDKTEAPKQTPIYLALCWFGRPFGQFVRSFPLWPLDRLSIIVCMLSVRGQRWMGGEIHHNGRKELVLARTCKHS